MFFVVHHHIDHDKCKEIIAFRTRVECEEAIGNNESTIVIDAIVNSYNPEDMFKLGGLLEGEAIPMQHILNLIKGQDVRVV